MASHPNYVKKQVAVDTVSWTAVAAVASGNAAAARITSNRALHVNLRNASGTEIGTASNPIRTDPTGTITQPVSGTVTGSQATAAARQRRARVSSP